MKTDQYQKRFYRRWVKALDLYRARIVVKETDLDILTDRPIDKKYVLQRVNIYRRQIEDYISRDRRFLTSLKPIAVELRAPLIVKEMAKQTKIANVGPMAAVAGAIAQFLGKDLLSKGLKEVIIENGGDIFLKINQTRCIGIYAGRSKLCGRFALKISPQDTPLGIGTSSGTVGHSLSFGSADSVTILSKNATLADAVVTATANRINSRKDFAKAIDFARSVKGVLGVLIIFKNNLASWGKVELAG